MCVEKFRASSLNHMTLVVTKNLENVNYVEE
jgi:hypothetical protein